ncbi:hypothetical protein BS17DRAFT_751725 [Gyrodon lividus]|nr:hypothetical protein BS17DRAFT_751725 [Gyrodon lividus]
MASRVSTDSMCVLKASSPCLRSCSYQPYSYALHVIRIPIALLVRHVFIVSLFTGIVLAR